MPDDTTTLLEPGIDSETGAPKGAEESMRRVCFLLLHDESAAEEAVKDALALAGDGTPVYRAVLDVCRQWLGDQVPPPRETVRRVRIRPRGILKRLEGRATPRRLSLVLGFLTQAQREAFVLHYVEELSHSEVADLLRCSSDTARSLAERAGITLQSKLPGLVL